MEKDTTRNIRLGIFVLAGTAFLIASLYMIGNKRNLFSNTFSIVGNFHTVNGLMPGNNVRFSGINVGTVQSVNILNDSSITVIMIIEEKYHPFIKKNSEAAIGTDGLMGNKLVNISMVKGQSAAVDDGDLIKTLQPIETDDMIRTLALTNDNIKIITENLKRITMKIDNSNSLWGLLSDTIVAENLRQAIVSIRMTGERSALVVGDLRGIAADIKSGKGPIGALITDTAMTGKIRQSVVSIQLLSDKMAIVTGDIGTLTTQVKSGQGTVGTLMMDTTFVGNLNQSILNLKSGTQKFDEDMEALKGSFLLKRYFRKQEKKNQGK
ncbi:MAG: MlaD family protein [Bacteroidetes bacterium]|jgi:phospholipid/cholesterol/gamma-HCH transport system substrate-binding protein|nr:MlaD family protein [Bacteroidota bacterium]